MIIGGKMQSCIEAVCDSIQNLELELADAVDEFKVDDVDLDTFRMSFIEDLEEAFPPTFNITCTREFRCLIRSTRFHYIVAFRFKPISGSYDEVDIEFDIERFSDVNVANCKFN